MIISSTFFPCFYFMIVYFGRFNPLFDFFEVHFGIYKTGKTLHPQSDFHRRGWKPWTVIWSAGTNNRGCIILLFAPSFGNAIGMRGELWGRRWGSAPSCFSPQPASIPFSWAGGELEHDGDTRRMMRAEEEDRCGLLLTDLCRSKVDSPVGEKKVASQCFLFFFWQAAAWVGVLWQTGSDSASGFITHTCWNYNSN